MRESLSLQRDLQSQEQSADPELEKEDYYITELERRKVELDSHIANLNEVKTVANFNREIRDYGAFKID